MRTSELPEASTGISSKASSVSTWKHVLYKHVKIARSSDWGQKLHHWGWKIVILELTFVFKESFALILFRISAHLSFS